MPANKVLSADWSDYDQRKLQQLQRNDWPEDDERRKKLTDPSFFAATEAWENIYLIGKIHTTHPHLHPETILAAIEFCHQKIGSPHERNIFVTSVMKKLEN